jgi:hypothetical protein
MLSSDGKIKMKNLLKYMLMTGGLVIASNSVGTRNSAPYTFPLSIEMNDSIKESNLEKTVGFLEDEDLGASNFDSIPALSKFKLESLNCSKYVQLAAQEHYGSVDSFPQRDAWNMRYASKIVAKLKTKNKYNEMEVLREEGILKPGMVLGVYNPFSIYRNTLDESGHKAKYTHVMLYVGKDKDGNLLFDHQWNKKTMRVSFDWMKENYLNPIEILDPLGKLSDMTIGKNGYEKVPRP